MYIHKYQIGDDIFYRVSKKASRPSRNITITFDAWRGYSSGSGVQNALKFLNGLTFSKEEIKEEEMGREEKTARAEKIKSIIERLDKVADELQNDGYENIALAIDQISDHLEGKRF